MSSRRDFLRTLAAAPVALSLPGRAAGMPVIVAAYGYLGDGPPPRDWKADAIVDSVAELEAWMFDAPKRAAMSAR